MIGSWCYTHLTIQQIRGLVSSPFFEGASLSIRVSRTESPTLKRKAGYPLVIHLRMDSTREHPYAYPGNAFQNSLYAERSLPESTYPNGISALTQRFVGQTGRRQL